MWLSYRGSPQLTQLTGSELRVCRCMSYRWSPQLTHLTGSELRVCRCMSYRGSPQLTRRNAPPHRTQGTEKNYGAD